jgi:hypothetical protein
MQVNIYDWACQVNEFGVTSYAILRDDLENSEKACYKALVSQKR